MEIKYSKKKQEERQDPFLDFLAKAKEIAVAQSNVLMGAGIALCIIVAGVFVYGYVQNAGQQKVLDAFGKAMVAYSSGDERKAVEALKTVVDNSKSSPQGAYSAFLLGSMFLRQDKYDEAIGWFSIAASGSSKAGFVTADAQEGLADCYEAKGSRQEAVACLSKALSDSRLKYRYPALAWKAALISKDLGNASEAARFCKLVESDTTAGAANYRQKAENLVEEIAVSRTN